MNPKINNKLFSDGSYAIRVDKKITIIVVDNEDN